MNDKSLQLQPLAHRLASALAGLHGDFADGLRILPVAFLGDAVTRRNLQRHMVLWGADTAKVEWMAADSAGSGSKALKAAGRHFCCVLEAFGGVGFSEGTQCLDFLGLGRGTAIW